MLVKSFWEGVNVQEKSPLNKASFLLKMKSLKKDKIALSDIILCLFFQGILIFSCSSYLLTFHRKGRMLGSLSKQEVSMRASLYFRQQLDDSKCRQTGVSSHEL